MISRNIRSVRGYLRSLPDWTDFNECFAPSNIKISDIDGVVERNGRFLLMDFKSPDVHQIPKGQSILYEAFARLDPFTVLIVHGRTNNDVPGATLRSGAEALIADLGTVQVERYTEYRRSSNGTITPVSTEATTADLKRFIRAWFEKANQRWPPR